MKKLMLLALVASTHAQSAQAACVANGSASLAGHIERSNGAEQETAPVFGHWDHAEPASYPGSMFATQGGTVQGAAMVYSGPADGRYATFGNYFNYSNISKFFGASSMIVSTNWRPDGREVCTNHKTKSDGRRVCVAKGMEYFETSFTVDIAVDGGQVIYAKTFHNANNINAARLSLPNVECDGDVNNLEYRIRGLAGGSVDFTVHSLDVNHNWNDK